MNDLVACSPGVDIRIYINNGFGLLDGGTTYTTVSGFPVWSDVADVDNDGDIDLVVTASNNINVFLNNGDNVYDSPSEYPSGLDVKAIQLGDLDGDGDLDVAAIGYSTALCSSLLNDGAGTFGDPNVYNTSGTAKGIALVDIDRDGDLDAVTANERSRTIDVLLNDGTGRLGWANSCTIPGYQIANLKCGDLDNDNDLDAVVINLSGNVVVMTNSGNGELEKSALQNLGIQRYFDIGDLDDDGDKDLVGANASGAVIFKNTDGIHFVYQDTLSVTAPQWVVLEDFDHDGSLDIGVNSNTNREVLVFVNKGNGVYAPPAVTSIGNFVPKDMVTANMNGDEFPDVVLSNYNPDQLYVLLNDDTGLFTLVHVIAVGKDPDTIAHGDFNEDGFDDLVVYHYQTTDPIRLYLNNGDGTVIYYKPIHPARSSKSLEVADFNNDGHLDLALANTIFFNDGSAS